MRGRAVPNSKDTLTGFCMLLYKLIKKGLHTIGI